MPRKRNFLSSKENSRLFIYALRLVKSYGFWWTSDWVRYGEILAVLFSHLPISCIVSWTLCMQRIRENKYKTDPENQTFLLKKLTEFEEIKLEKLIIDQS